MNGCYSWENVKWQGQYYAKINLVTHIWVRTLDHKRHRTTSTLVPIMACRIRRRAIILTKYEILLGRRQDIIWTYAGILSIRNLGANFSEILSRIPTLSFKKMHLKISSAIWRSICCGLDVLNEFMLLSTDSRRLYNISLILHFM